MISLSRQFDTLEQSPFDLLVIGAGIVGAAVAWDASLRGMKVLLVERNDFGRATSSGCFRIIHGGLRYLQHLDFARLNESVREQRTLRLIAPHLLKPLPFLVPCYGYGKRGRPFLRTGMMLYDVLAQNRNEKVADAVRLPGHKVLNTSEVRQMAPGIPTEGLTGGVIFYDAQLTHCERFTFSVVKSAAAAGATVINYCEASGGELASVGGGREIKSVTLTDKLSRKVIKVSASQIVNATGPKCEAVLGQLGFAGAGRGTLLPNGAQLSKGFQVVLPRIVESAAVAVESKDFDATSVVRRGGRSYFLVPWRGVTIAGTTDAPLQGDETDFKVTLPEVSQFISELRSAYDDKRIDVANVQGVFGGLLPTEELESSVPKDKIRIAKRDIVIDHGLCDHVQCNNLLSVAGVKYTTFRALAERVVDLVAEKVAGSWRKCVTTSTALCENGEVGVAISSKRIRNQTLVNLTEHYGPEAQAVCSVIEEESRFMQPVAAGGTTLLGEIAFALRHEMALTLEDIVLSRTAIGAEGWPGDVAVEKITQFMAGELGWDKGRQDAEVQRLRERMTMGLVA